MGLKDVIKTTERKWRIIEHSIRKNFYEKIAKYEAMGYKLHPESFCTNTTGISKDTKYLALMSLNSD